MAGDSITTTAERRGLVQPTSFDPPADPSSALALAPAWSASGLRAGSGLGRYTNAQPGVLRSMYAAQPVGQQAQQVSGYQAPALRSIADRVAQYQQQAAAAAAAAAAQQAAAAQSQPGANDSGDSSGVSGGFGDGVGSGQSVGSAIASELGIDSAMEGGKLGFSLGGLPGAVVGGLLGLAQTSDPTNPSSVNAVNGLDAANPAVSTAPVSYAVITDQGIGTGGDGGLTSSEGLGNAGLSATEGFGGFGVSVGEGFGGGLSDGFGNGHADGFGLGAVGESSESFGGSEGGDGGEGGK